MKSQSTNIDFAYAVDEVIEARDPSFRADASGGWRTAVVHSLAPYRGKAGYYIGWLPVPTEQWQSSGGWTYEAVMRKKVEKAA